MDGLSVHSIAADPSCFSRRVSCHAKTSRRLGIHNFHVDFEVVPMVSKAQVMAITSGDS
jgi:hypothetical protein